MDQSRFLKLRKHYCASLAFLVWIFFGLWWYFWYQPLLAQIKSFRYNQGEMDGSAAPESLLKNQIVEQQCELLRLKSHYNVIFKRPCFSSVTLSKDIFSLVSSAGLVLVHIRTESGRYAKSFGFEITVRGSYAQCYSFLTACRECGGLLVNCSLKKNSETGVVDLGAHYKISDIDSNCQGLLDYRCKDFSTHRNVFQSRSIENKAGASGGVPFERPPDRVRKASPLPSTSASRWMPFSYVKRPRKKVENKPLPLSASVII